MWYGITHVIRMLHLYYYICQRGRDIINKYHTTLKKNHCQIYTGCKMLQFVRTDYTDNQTLFPTDSYVNLLFYNFKNVTASFQPNCLLDTLYIVTFWFKGSAKTCRLSKPPRLKPIVTLILRHVFN